MEPGSDFHGNVPLPSSRKILETNHTRTLPSKSAAVLVQRGREHCHRCDHLRTSYTGVVAIAYAQIPADFFDRHLLPWLLVSAHPMTLCCSGCMASPIYGDLLITPTRACSISIVRFKFIVFPDDFTFNNAEAAIWSIAELCAGIICACLPALRPLFFQAIVTPIRQRQHMNPLVYYWQRRDGARTYTARRLTKTHSLVAGRKASATTTLSNTNSDEEAGQRVHVKLARPASVKQSMP